MNTNVPLTECKVNSAQCSRKYLDDAHRCIKHGGDECECSEKSSCHDHELGDLGPTRKAACCKAMFYCKKKRNC